MTRPCLPVCKLLSRKINILHKAELWADSRGVSDKNKKVKASFCSFEAFYSLMSLGNVQEKPTARLTGSSLKKYIHGY